MLNESLIVEVADYKSWHYELEMDRFKEALVFDKSKLYGDLNYGKRNGRQMILDGDKKYQGEVTYKDGKLDGPILLLGSDDCLKAEGEYQEDEMIYVKEIKPDVTKSWAKNPESGYHCEVSFRDGKVRVRFNVDENNMASGSGVVIEEGQERKVYFEKGDLKERSLLWVWILAGIAFVSGIVGGIMYMVRRH